MIMSEEATAPEVAVQAEISASTDWRSSLPEDIRSSKVFDNVADVNSLAKQFMDAQSHIGNSIRIPGEDAGQEALDAFHAKLMNKNIGLMAKPESPEDYAKVFESMGKPVDSKGYVNPEGVEGYDNLRELALSANMTNKQFESMVNSVAGLDAAALENTQAAQKESRGVIEKEWGAAFDQNSTQAIALLEATGAPESLVALAKEGNIDGDSLKWFHALSQKLSGGEGSTAVGDVGHSQVMTPTEAASQLHEMMSNKESPYWNTSDRRHKEFQDKAMGLRKLKKGKAA
jgi:hypothetical protein